MLMGDIYSTSNKVIAWLGPEQSDSVQALSVMDRLLTKRDALFELDEETYDDEAAKLLTFGISDALAGEGSQAWDSLWDFFRRTWFHRCWTMQEAILNKQEMILMAGPKEIQWERLRDFGYYAQQANWAIEPSTKTWLLKRQTKHEPEKAISFTLAMRDVLFGEKKGTQDQYPGRLVQGTEQRQVLLASVHLLLQQIRARSATDPRDKVYGIYGIVSKLCEEHDLVHPLLFPDYSQSVEDVLISNIRSLLSHSESLLILSSVEDRSARQLKGLPSWVPDLTAPGAGSLAKYHPGNLFSAAKVSKATFLPTEDTRILSLVGHFVDEIVQISELLDDDDPSRIYMESDLNLLQAVPDVYFNGQDRLEAFWRTLIDDVVDDRTPAPSETSKDVYDCLLYLYARLLVTTWDKGEECYNAAFERLKLFLRSMRTTSAELAMISSFDDVLHRSETYKDFYRPKPWPPGRKNAPALEHFEPGSLGSDSKTHGYMAESHTRGHHFLKLLRVVELSTRFKTTAGGLLGHVPVSTMAGDRIFILEGARVPFVLRPSHDKDRDTFHHEIVGEAYVHGIMQGEALSRGVPIKMDPLLV